MVADSQESVFVILPGGDDYLKEPRSSNDGLTSAGAYLVVCPCPYWLSIESKPFGGGWQAEVELLVFSAHTGCL